MTRSPILVVDDEANLRKILGALLRSEGYPVFLAATIDEAKHILQTERIHAVLTDLRLKREDGLWLLRWIRESQLPTPVIILTAHGTVDSAVDAMKQGAFDYVSKPFDRGELSRVIRKALLTHQFQSHLLLRDKGGSSYPMVGQNEKMKKVFALCDKVAETDSTVLITGESGTGKELVAQAIHERSDRKCAPLIKLNCAAIPHSLMESELFGHERGAFTGAVNAKPGRFELADKGTLFLDEIGEMSIEMQVKLLRVLQDGTFERVGGVRTLTSEVRLIAATNKDLSEAVREGEFREDLYYRLNVVPIHLPPLRDRPDDIPRLIAHFVTKLKARFQKPDLELSGECLEQLSSYAWPGNIRQLENVLERMIVIADVPTLTPEQLPEDIRDDPKVQVASAAQAPSMPSLKDRVKDVTRRIEKDAIQRALRDTRNNVTQAAKSLNISRKGLQLKMKELGIR